MRPTAALLAIAALAAGAGAVGVTPAAAVCSVFDRHPCHPTFCGVFHRGPCIPEIEYPIGQDLRLTIESVADKDPPKRSDESAAKIAADPDDGNPDAGAARKLDSIREMFAALRACWVPPGEDEARTGMQMSVRLAFKRTGEIIGTPRVTYASPDAPRTTRDIYRGAITAALSRCTPLPLSEGMGGAVAGRPIAIRFVDNRKFEGQREKP